MAICRAYLERRRLYRGQKEDYGSIAASLWRKRWIPHQTLNKPLQALIDAYVLGSKSPSQLASDLASLTSALGMGTSFYHWLANGAGAALLIDLLTHIRQSLGAQFRPDAARIQLEQLEQSFNVRFHQYFFNNTEDVFFRRTHPHTLRQLVEIMLMFYDQDRSAFDVEFRIAQVVLDIVGVLQHYGVLGSPGIDLTGDLDVALWFATHEFGPEANAYQTLPPERWGVVYEFDVPVVRFSPMPIRGAVPVDELPRVRVIELASLSPHFTRIVRQNGFYAIDQASWSSSVDFAKLFVPATKKVTAFGSVANVARRVSRLTQEYLFPSAQQDPFKAHLAQFNIDTFL